MRLIIKTTQNKETIPFNYQPKLVGCLHKWIGKANEVHDEMSMYSFSWLQNTIAHKNGLDIKRNGSWFINAHDENLLKSILKGIQSDPSMFLGIEVNELSIQPNPDFNEQMRFNVASPVFIKRNIENRTKFYYKGDIEANDFLTQTIKYKLTKAGLSSEGVSVGFDETYLNYKLKGCEYNGIFNKGTICPEIIKGTKEQITFTWNVGIGNSTGIGFGALI
jgi:CRISPR-associated endoribonuclease Cas6